MGFYLFLHLRNCTNCKIMYISQPTFLNALIQYQSWQGSPNCYVIVWMILFQVANPLYGYEQAAQTWYRQNSMELICQAVQGKPSHGNGWNPALAANIITFNKAMRLLIFTTSLLVMLLELSRMGTFVLNAIWKQLPMIYKHTSLHLYFP